MTALLGTWVSRIGSALQTAPLVAIGVIGVIVGTVGSLTLGGRATGGSTSSPLPLFVCPDGATQIGEVTRASRSW